MSKGKRLVLICFGIALFAAVALVGGLIGKKTGKMGGRSEDVAGLRCANDGTRINPFYQVDAYLLDNTAISFCCIYCATKWLENNPDKAVYFTVVDEMTGQKFDSTLGHFVRSEVVTVPEVKNRVHAFYLREDALTHAKQFGGELIDNPFGKNFVLPERARFDSIHMGAQALPDAVPLQMAVFRPIFKENRLEVEIVPFGSDSEGMQLLQEGTVDGIICDLPTGLALAGGTTRVRIVKNVLRANPYRPLFALVGGEGVKAETVAGMKDLPIAVPEGVGFQFYAEYYLQSLGISPEAAVIRTVEDCAAAWELLGKGAVKAALLRTPYTDMAMARKAPFLADDRSLPWMSVMVFHQSVIEQDEETVRRFIFGLEQSVLALNLKPDEFRSVLQEKGGIPEGGKKAFPMPIFEGANCPSPDEVQPIVAWLAGKGFMSPHNSYEDLVDARFLPNPDDVGLAFCCR